MLCKMYFNFICAAKGFIEMLFPIIPLKIRHSFPAKIIPSSRWTLRYWGLRTLARDLIFPHCCRVEHRDISVRAYPLPINILPSAPPGSFFSTHDMHSLSMLVFDFGRVFPRMRARGVSKVYSCARTWMLHLFLSIINFRQIIFSFHI